MDPAPQTLDAKVLFPVGCETDTDAAALGDAILEKLKRFASISGVSSLTEFMGNIFAFVESEEDTSFTIEGWKKYYGFVFIFLNRCFCRCLIS